jgi:hypothetical protein
VVCVRCMCACFFHVTLAQLDNGLRFDVSAKAELHARLHTLVSSLWDVVDAREAAGHAEVLSLEADGWVSDAQQARAQLFAGLVQQEVSRFVVVGRVS